MKIRDLKYELMESIYSKLINILNVFFEQNMKMKINYFALLNTIILNDIYCLRG